MSVRAIMMNFKDNVATLLSDADVGAIVLVASADGKVIQKVKTKQPIPFGHKIAITKIGRKELVLKYGEVIGEATEPIEEGEHVHVHNVKSLRVRVETKPSQGGIT
jgi:hypothetical protein